MDESPLLDLYEPSKFQILIVMLQWLVTIGRPDLSHALTTLNRFILCPREYYLNLMVSIFDLLKQIPSPVIVINSRPLEYGCTAHYEKLIPAFLKDYSHICTECIISYSKHLVHGLILPSWWIVIMLMNKKLSLLNQFNNLG